MKGNQVDAADTPLHVSAPTGIFEVADYGIPIMQVSRLVAIA